MSKYLDKKYSHLAMKCKIEKDEKNNYAIELFYTTQEQFLEYNLFETIDQDCLENYCIIMQSMRIALSKGNLPLLDKLATQSRLYQETLCMTPKSRSKLLEARAKEKESPDDIVKRQAELDMFGN